MSPPDAPQPDWLVWSRFKLRPLAPPPPPEQRAEAVYGDWILDTIAPEVDPAFYFKQLLAALRLAVLPITPEIALLSRSSLFQHGDPADRLIGATALHLGTPLITADAKLRALESLDTVW